jgi:hypothetical protein
MTGFPQATYGLLCAQLRQGTWSLVFRPAPEDVRTGVKRWEAQLALTRLTLFDLFLAPEYQGTPWVTVPEGAPGALTPVTLMGGVTVPVLSWTFEALNLDPKGKDAAPLKGNSWGYWLTGTPL